MTDVGNTARDALIARTVRWAETEGLHPRALDYARKYANLTHAGLRIISAYETAADTGDKAAIAVAWDNTIRYMRTMKPAFEDSGRKVA
jgi:hypothetical protein